MHELSIAQDILSIVRQNVPHDELKNIQNVNVRIGTMAGVVPDSLEFSYQAITAGTEMENSKLSIEKIPFAVECKSCRKTSTNEIGLRICSHCGSPETTILSGLEMQVVDIELKEVVSEIQS